MFILKKQKMLILLVLAALLVVSGCKKPTMTGENPPGEGDDPEPVVEYSPISHLPLVESGDVCAVSIGNNPGARPQSGLAFADLVYEVLAEGGITRYLAIFHSDAPIKVGPVRSARPYLALLAKEHNALFAHCGGDPKDLKPIASWNVKDADEFTYSSLYSREDSRRPPDNLYTSIEDLRDSNLYPADEPKDLWEFGDWSDTPVQALKITYSKNYAIGYVYNKDNYLRYVIDNGTTKEHSDLDTDEPLLVSNVIVQFADHKVVYSDLGLEITLLGEGKAAYLLGGEYVEGTWKKESVESPTVFFTEDKDEITLVPGLTFIQIVPTDAKVSVSEECQESPKSN